MGDSFVIAIDFGTAYSGHAFSMTARDAVADIHIKMWGEDVCQQTPKTPTCILFNEKEEFFRFGYKAKTKYFRMRGQQAKDYFFFDNFKMSLYGKNVNRDLKIKAANGKELSALKVFTEALRFLKDDALETINNSVAGKKFIASDFTWVLTVPAIWDHSAKQFMREAAMQVALLKNLLCVNLEAYFLMLYLFIFQAGIATEINKEKLIIALEPEAASVWCKKLPADGFIAERQGKDTLDQSPKTQYVVVDCGGGTIDITVHEVLEGGALKELHKASGNNLGGQTVDRKCKEFLKEIFSDGVWDEFEKNHPNDVMKMMNDFTLFKKQDDNAEIDCPFNLGEIAQQKKTMEDFFKVVQGASWDEGSIVISKQKLRDFFAESLQGITQSLQEIFTKGLNIKYILLVGGYANSKILQKHFTDKFEDKCKILCPVRPQEAILRGAVEFGRNPHLVASRKSAFTYGVRVSRRFERFKHKPEKKIINKDGEWCRDIFMKLVESGEDVGWDETRTFSLYPTQADMTTMNYNFYCTKKRRPKYVDEEGIDKIGCFLLNSPNTKRGLHRELKLNIKFGFTEMTAQGVDIDSKLTSSIELDFMRN
ncbi:heat shock 70 kDa protein 12A [Fundulus heteroclitus]|uniref:heat shock 70 kDa protein 12A n=1 Tax=Fundulus heteroclitus TaxID=8078 RepID=UPI00165BD9E8|nr:heat shock 70 kDa protein 12A [Fundulus heteroclitus]